MKPLFPPRPAAAPVDLTRPSRRYRLRVVLVLVSLLLTLVLYVALVIGSAWLCYWLVTAPWPARVERGYLFVRIAAIVCSGLLFLYLLKGLFKRSQVGGDWMVEIQPREQPELFDFIYRVCAETGAPRPHKVYLTPEVNAAVFYHASFLSLILPTRKNLLIGLGLVNMVNLSEFKAVLAHEFGHFSQKSMKLGSYVYVANKVLADIVYGRDFLDEMLRQAKGTDIRIAIFVWTFLGVLWVLRKILEGVFKAINIFNSSLSRQMEFNADRVAVSVAGSDVIVTTLLRTGFADQAYRQVGADLWAAADHGLYSRDMFFHQRPAAEQVRRLAKNPKLGEPPAEAGQAARVFSPDEGNQGIPLMWATHPPNHERERSAKEIYVPAETDERSPWLLFRDEAAVRFRVTQRWYELVQKPQQPQYVDAERVQAFIDDEYAETTYPERYAGFYENRYLELDDVDRLPRSEAAVDEALAELAQIYTPGLKTWVEENHKRLQESDQLFALKAGGVGSIQLRGQAVYPHLADRLLADLQKELDEDQKTKADLDRRVFLAFHRLARETNAELAGDLLERYRFHQNIQNLHRALAQALNQAQWALNRAGGRELSQREFADLIHHLQGSAQILRDSLASADRLQIPTLRNMPAKQRLGPFLLAKQPLVNLSSGATSIPPAWLSDLFAQLGEVMDKLRRLLFKSLGGILAAHEQIERQLRDAKAAAPVVNVEQKTE
jgi:Zn-dependent protease with chaperone function